MLHSYPVTAGVTWEYLTA